MSPYRPMPEEPRSGWVQLTARLQVRSSFIEKVVDSLGVTVAVLKDGTAYEVGASLAHEIRHELANGRP